MSVIAPVIAFMLDIAHFYSSATRPIPAIGKGKFSRWIRFENGTAGAENLDGTSLEFFKFSVGFTEHDPTPILAISEGTILLIAKLEVGFTSSTLTSEKEF